MVLLVTLMAVIHPKIDLNILAQNYFIQEIHITKFISQKEALKHNGSGEIADKLLPMDTADTSLSFGLSGAF